MSLYAAPLWTGLGLIAPLGARVSGGVPPPAAGVSIDTRTLVSGDLFFAITGDATDGHDYVRKAFAAGAVACVVDEAHADALAGTGPLLIVKDVLASMVSLGRAARARTQARVVAVTGSVGKTSTKEALRVALTPAGALHASAASYNNHWGVPLTLARMPAEAQFCVAEIGMNHAGEITPLVAMVRPHVAIVTNVSPVHLEFFPSVEAIADAKAEIFSGLEPGGVAIINRDSPHFERLDAAARLSPPASSPPSAPTSMPTRGSSTSSRRRPTLWSRRASSAARSRSASARPVATSPRTRWRCCSPPMQSAPTSTSPLPRWPSSRPAKAAANARRSRPPTARSR